MIHHIRLDSNLCLDNRNLLDTKHKSMYSLQLVHTIQMYKGQEQLIRLSRNYRVGILSRKSNLLVSIARQPVHYRRQDLQRLSDIWSQLDTICKFFHLRENMSLDRSLLEHSKLRHMKSQQDKLSKQSLQLVSIALQPVHYRRQDLQKLQDIWSQLDIVCIALNHQLSNILLNKLSLQSLNTENQQDMKNKLLRLHLRRFRLYRLQDCQLLQHKSFLQDIKNRPLC